jgi:hypothetical protein
MNKSIVKSTTTRSVAASAAGTTAGIIGLLAWVRATFGDAVPWPDGLDTVIVIGANTVVIPLVSRIIKAWAKSKSDQNDRQGSNLPLLVLLCAAMSLAGCASLLPQRSVTVTYPDGRVEVTTTADTEATVAMLEVQLAALEQAVQTWRDIAEWQSGQDKLDAEAKAEDRAAQADQLRLLLQGLRELSAHGAQEGE